MWCEITFEREDGKAAQKGKSKVEKRLAYGRGFGVAF
jgi:hypothetical protein